MTKVTVESALNVESDDDLDDSKHRTSPYSDSWNSFSTKTISTGGRLFNLETPRDREGFSEPQLVKKQQRPFTSINDFVQKA